MNVATEKHPEPSVPNWITVQGLSERWAMKADTIRRMCRAGTIPSIKLGGKVMVRIDALREMFDDTGTPRTKA